MINAIQHESSGRLIVHGKRFKLSNRSRSSTKNETLNVVKQSVPITTEGYFAEQTVEGSIVKNGRGPQHQEVMLRLETSDKSSRQCTIIGTGSCPSVGGNQTSQISPHVYGA